MLKSIKSVEFTNAPPTKSQTPPAPTRWERVAQSTWGRYMSAVEKHSILLGETLAQPAGQAIEIGCEGGRWSKILESRGWSMTCIDISTAALTECQRKVPRATCILARPDDVTIPCGSGSTSLILCIEVAPVMDSVWFCAEAGRVLRPGGIVVGVALNLASWRGIFARLKSVLGLGNPSKFYQRTYCALRSDFIINGFDFVSERGFCWAPFGRCSNSVFVPLFVKMERFFRLDRLPILSPWIVFIAKKKGISPSKA